MIYDITNSKTFEALTKWLEDIKQYGPEDINIIIVGNKIDLNFQRDVSYQEASSLADKFNVNYIEVSALTGKNIPEIFEVLTNQMLKQEQLKEDKRIKKGKIDKSHVTANHNLSLDQSMNSNNKKDKESKCC